MNFTCTWCGKDFPGKGYLLATTEGTEIVDPVCFTGAIPEPEPPKKAPAKKDK